MVRPLSRRALWMHKLADEVARGLMARIETGEIAAGSGLPDRDTLAAEFVTSPSVIDRALDLMRERGYVVADEDSGHRVAEVPPRAHRFELPQNVGATRDDIVAVLELRMGVELISAALAAQRRSPAALARIQAAQTAFSAAGTRGHGIGRADFELHCEIARASGNPYILDLLEYLGPLLVPRMRAALPFGTPGGDRHYAASEAEHARIVAAIAAGDGDAARVAMREHLTRSIDMVRAIG